MVCAWIKVTTAGRWGSLPGRWGVRRLSVAGEKRKSAGERGGVQGTALGSGKDAWLAQPLPPDTCPLGKVA